MFEGPDGVGKSTLCEATYAALQRDGKRVTRESFPGRSPGTIGKLVYDIHHEPARFGLGVVSPLSLQALHVAAHLDLLRRVIQPAIADGQTVILDRYWWSTWVYGQDAGIVEAELDALLTVERLAWLDVAPSPLFLISTLASRDKTIIPSTFESLSRRYKLLAEREASSCEVVSIVNDSSIEATMESILRSVHE